MGKVKVPVFGTVGKAVFVDPDLEARVAALEAALAALRSASGTTRHSSLQGLQVGDDHPQYTMWQARENITGQWSFVLPIWGANGTAALPSYTFTSDVNTGVCRVGEDDLGVTTGGTLRWDVNTARVYQNLYLNVEARNGALFESPDYTIGQVGIEMMNFPGSDPNTDGIGNQLAFWEAGTQAIFTNRTYGFRIRHTGEVNNEGNLDWYRHNNNTAGVLFLRMTRDSSQIQFANGSASAPVITHIGDENTGIYFATADEVNVATAGTLRLTVNATNVLAAAPFRGEAGSAGSPTYSWRSGVDSNSGMYSIGDNDIGWSTDGTARMRLTTTFWRSSLQCQGADGSAGTPSWSFTSDTNTGRYWVSADLMAESVGGTQRATWSTTALRLVQDNYEMQLGASSDLRLYHDGTNSIIENDTGSLIARVNGDFFVNEGGFIVGAESAVLGSRGVELLGVGSTSFMSSIRYGASANPATFEVLKSRGASVGTNTIVQDGDAVGAFTGYGANGTGFDNCASVQFTIDGTPGASGDMPGDISFYTTADGSASLTRRMRIRSTGFVQLVQDSQELQIGAGQDLRLYHDGTNSFIRNDTGELRIQAGTTVVAAATTARLDCRLPLQLQGYTVATLPAGAQGDTAYVTDALAPTFLTAVVGGGAVVTPVFYDGTNWVSY